MKTLKLIVFGLMPLSVILAQSDYKTVNEFKLKLQEIQKNIEIADSIDYLNSLLFHIDQLESEYKDEKDLLDQSLYPENFYSSLSKLRKEIRVKRNGFFQREVLAIKVGELEEELERLNNMNTNLLAEIYEYREIGGSPDEIKRLVSQLRTTLNKRDQLVKNMVDSLLTEFVNHPMSLGQAELKKTYEKIESGKLFYNVEKTIRDNIEFIKVTSLKPADLGEIKEDQVQFFSLWSKLGPKIAESYSGTKNKSEDVEYINSLFSEWEHKLDDEIWKNINLAFVENNIEVAWFNSSDTFVNNVTDYIDSQISNFDTLGYDQSYLNFENFEKIWRDELKSTWLPILRDNQIISEGQTEILQIKMDEWQINFEEAPSNIGLYAGIFVGIVLIIFAYILGTKSKNRYEKKEITQP